MTMTIKYCIFDLDGTLINSLYDLADAMNYALERNGFPTHDREKYRFMVGSGIWISRQDASKPIYIYAQHTNTLSSTVAAGTTALLGNPSQTSKAPTISGCAELDQIIVPTSGLPKTYTYKDSQWYSYTGLEKEYGLPTVTAGTGFWYVSKGSAAVTVSWQ